MTPFTHLGAAHDNLRDAEVAVRFAREQIAAALPEGMYARQLDAHAEKIIAATAFLADEVSILRRRAGRPS